MNEQITLACNECKRHNYSTTKNKKNVPGKLVLKKFCKFCKHHVEHTEIK